MFEYKLVFTVSRKINLVMEKSPLNSSVPTGDKKEDGEILADALSSVVNRINDTYSRLAKLERQLNLHPRSAQEYSESLKQYDQMLQTLLAITHTAEQSKVPSLQHQVNHPVNSHQPHAGQFALGLVVCHQAIGCSFFNSQKALRMGIVYCARVKLYN